MPGGDRCRAGRRRARPPVDLDQAQPARAEGGSRLSVAHSLGMSMPASAAARRTDVPSGTVTARPSIVTGTSGPPAVPCWLGPAGAGGVPRSRLALQGHDVAPGREVLGEVAQRRCARAAASARPWRTASRRPSPRRGRSSRARLASPVLARRRCGRSPRRRAPRRRGTACTCRTTPRRRTPSRTGPAGPCRRCRRTRRCRRGRACAPAAANAS